MFQLNYVLCTYQYISLLGIKVDFNQKNVIPSDREIATNVIILHLWSTVYTMNVYVCFFFKIIYYTRSSNLISLIHKVCRRVENISTIILSFEIYPHVIIILCSVFKTFPYTNINVCYLESY